MYLLPDLEQKPLFDQFHLDEPWDSPHNQALIPQMPAIYVHPGHPLPPGRTIYLAAVGPGTVFQGPRPGALSYMPGAPPTPPPLNTFQGPLPGSTSYKDMGPRLADLGVGPSTAVMIVEANPDDSVIWTAPDDFMFDPNDPWRGLKNVWQPGCQVAYFDGRTELLFFSTDEATLRRMFQYQP